MLLSNWLAVSETAHWTCTGIPQFTLLVWGLKKKKGSKNRVNQGYLGEENRIELWIGVNRKSRKIETAEIKECLYIQFWWSPSLCFLPLILLSAIWKMLIDKRFYHIVCNFSLLFFVFNYNQVRKNIEVKILKPWVRHNNVFPLNRKFQYC